MMAMTMMMVNILLCRFQFVAPSLIHAGDSDSDGKYDGGDAEYDFGGGDMGEHSMMPGSVLLRGGAPKKKRGAHLKGKGNYVAMKSVQARLETTTGSDAEEVPIVALD